MVCFQNNFFPKKMNKKALPDCYQVKWQMILTNRLAIYTLFKLR